MNVLFFGSSRYCLPVLQSLSENFQLKGVVTRPDRPAGRSGVPAPTEVKLYAAGKNIPVFTPEDKTGLLSLKTEFEKLAPDLAVVSDYGLIIPPDIFRIPLHRTVNIHFSRLPELRGASPVQYTLLNGGQSAWITFQLMDKGMDTGDIISQNEVKIDGNETAETLYLKLFNIAAGLIPDVLNRFANGEIKPSGQNGDLATYTKKLDREDGFLPFEIFKAALTGNSEIDFSSFNSDKNPLLLSMIINKLKASSDRKSGTIIERAIRAFSPWPGVYTEVKIEDKNTEVKRRLKIIKAGILNNLLIPEIVQIEGKNPVSWKQFLAGYPRILK